MKLSENRNLSKQCRTLGSDQVWVHFDGVSIHRETHYGGEVLSDEYKFTLYTSFFGKHPEETVGKIGCKYVELYFNDIMKCHYYPYRGYVYMVKAVGGELALSFSFTDSAAMKGESSAFDFAEKISSAKVGFEIEEGESWMNIKLKELCE